MDEPNLGAYPSLGTYSLAAGSAKWFKWGHLWLPCLFIPSYFLELIEWKTHSTPFWILGGEVNNSAHSANNNEHMVDYEKPVTAANIHLDVPNQIEYKSPQHALKALEMLSGQEREMSATKIQIRLVPDSKQFKSVRYRVCLKREELECP